MNTIEFNSEQQAILVEKVQKYCEAELDLEMGRFDAEFFLEFITKEMGGFFYNQGLHDALALFEKKIEGLSQNIYELEMPTAL